MVQSGVLASTATLLPIQTSCTRSSRNCQDDMFKRGKDSNATPQVFISSMLLCHFEIPSFKSTPVVLAPSRPLEQQTCDATHHSNIKICPRLTVIPLSVEDTKESKPSPILTASKNTFRRRQVAPESLLHCRMSIRASFLSQ